MSSEGFEVQKAYCINPCATRCPGNSKRCAKRPPPSLSLYALTTTSAADSWSPVRNGPPLLLSASASGCSEPSNRLICAAEAPPPRPQERPEAPAAASSPEGGCAGVCHMTRVLCTQCVLKLAEQDTHSSHQPRRTCRHDRRRRTVNKFVNGGRCCWVRRAKAGGCVGKGDIQPPASHVAVCMVCLQHADKTAAPILCTCNTQTH